ncbi:hypothetical protein [Sulfobacillus harzensis]|uniref:Uncharacterized protein n=1 Tax=Sulfobacillus harzensis TaxID=2729629 RepID=A0A7Y0Q457_9FIRM|nr:hypothetical protein [Sulfobacillus harzensis]NMP24272.1 hypothetical protein [Sulfobacillus harzensis]
MKQSIRETLPPTWDDTWVHQTLEQIWESSRSLREAKNKKGASSNA